MRIEMYNMGFGEAILLEDGDNNTQKFLVDMGSKLKNFDFKNVWDSMDLEDNKYELMLSHFHEDHMNGLRDGREKGYDIPKAGNIYIPSILDIKVDSIEYLDLLLYYYFFKYVLNLQNRVTSLFEILHYAISCKGKITFLKKGKEFRFATHKYNVLWPDPGSDIFKQEDKSFLSIITALKETQDWTDIENAVRECAGTVRNVFEALSKDNVEEQLIENGISENILEEQKKKLVNLADEKRKKFDSKIKEKIRYWCDKFHPKQNEVSIVFHDDTEGENANIFFTGDITAEIFEKEIEGVKKQYQVFKVPHHGTASHYHHKFPDAKYYLISNGEGNILYGKIDERYGLYYNNVKKCNFICTNKRCNLVDLYGIECNNSVGLPKCPKSCPIGEGECQVITLPCK